MIFFLGRGNSGGHRVGTGRREEEANRETSDGDSLSWPDVTSIKCLYSKWESGV